MNLKRKYLLEDELFVASLEDAKQSGSIVNYYDYFYQPNVPGSPRPKQTDEFKRLSDEVLKVYQITIHYSTNIWKQIDQLKKLIKESYNHIAYCHYETDGSNRIIVCVLLDNDLPEVSEILDNRMKSSSVALSDLRTEIKHRLQELATHKTIFLKRNYLISDEDLSGLKRELREKGYSVKRSWDNIEISVKEPLTKKFRRISAEAPAFGWITISAIIFVFLTLLYNFHFR